VILAPLNDVIKQEEKEMTKTIREKPSNTIQKIHVNKPRSCVLETYPLWESFDFNVTLKGVEFTSSSMIEIVEQ
jgi:hypothetical protein